MRLRSCLECHTRVTPVFTRNKRRRSKAYTWLMFTFVGITWRGVVEHSIPADVDEGGVVEMAILGDL